MVERVLTKEEKIARACHEVNRAYCLSIGDDSHLSWEEAPDWQRESAIAGVKAHLEAGPDGLDQRTSHLMWYEHKKAEGWKYGPVKDAEKKEHPCFCPYDELPPAQKAKDALFGAVVRSMRDVV